MFIIETYVSNWEYKWVLDPDYIILDIRVGYQVLLGKRFSIVLEPMLLIGLPFEILLVDQGYFEKGLSGAKLSLSWTFDLKRKPIYY